MSDKIVKKMIAAGAVSALFASPAAAQIARFHLMTPALPSGGLLQKTASEDEANDFVGSTFSMADEKSASLSDMRDSRSITGAANEDVVSDTDDTLGRDQTTDQARGNTRDDGDSWRSERLALGTPVEPRPEIDRQVIVRTTTTKSPRGSSKIRTGQYWSVGEFR